MDAVTAMSAPAVSRDTFADARFETERELLGALLAHRDSVSYSAAAAIVGPDSFGDDFNARLFSMIGRGVEQGLYAFPLTAWIIGQLRDDATLKELGTTASQIIARYMASQCPGIAIEGHARQIKHDSLSLALKQAVEDGETGLAEETAAEMERLSRAHLTKDDGASELSLAAHGVLEKLSAAYQSGQPANDFASAGLADLSRTIGGWRRGRFYVIAGRPGMGKTTFGLSTILRTALKGHGVLFFSLEMGRDELTEMALCDLAWRGSSRIEYRDIAASAVLQEGFPRKYESIHDVAPLLNSTPFLIVDKPGMSISEIRSRAMQYAQRLAANGRRLDVVCVDHLNLIAPSDAYRGNKSAETEEISMSLKRLAKELDIAVISLVQLNRAVEGREDKRPGLSDLRWSGAIEQDADVVMFVYREAYYLERKKHDDMAEEGLRKEQLLRKQNSLELIIAKHRGGPCPVLEFYCDMGCAVVRDKDRIHA